MNEPEPQQRQDNVDADPFLPAAAESAFRWLRGLPPPASGAEDGSSELAVLRETLTGIPGLANEPARIEATYRLAIVAAELESECEAMRALLDAFEKSGSEEQRRAAQYGLGSAGAAAVPSLLRMVSTDRLQLERQMPMHLQQCEADGATELTQAALNRLCKLTHALGEAAEVPTAEIVAEVQRVVETASLVAKVHAEKRCVAEARRLLTVAATALRCVGGWAVQRDDAELCATLGQLLVAQVNSGSGSEREAQAKA